MLKAVRKQSLKEMEHVYMWNYFQNCFHGALAQMSKSEGFTNAALRKKPRKGVF